ncbi:hypothetical protein [Streptomyces sp. NBC_00859]|uniref:hypothetical protein n=1 Tax=Streptomyces sp. NBC_00859 TaxID=2903682 RepID=UPI00386551C8|nr:hypothetical protein OG584_24720 [Streptomyces sp. NBC_00859]
MTVISLALALAIIVTSYVWPIVPLIVYPMRRRRGLLAALYCGALGLVCAVEFRDFHYMVGDFFKASVFTAVTRVVVEITGVAEPARRSREAARRSQS